MKLLLIADDLIDSPITGSTYRSDEASAGGAHHERARATHQGTTTRSRFRTNFGVSNLS
jgi:hypothetical protein